MKTGCVILAGGKSSRMGQDKALLSIDGSNFIEYLSREFSFFEEKMIARGNLEAVDGLTWSVVPDVYPDHGPIGGLHAALERCQSDALFCVACDTPLLKADTYHLLKIHMTEEDDAVIAVTEDDKCHPLCGIYRKSIASVMEEQILADNNKMMSVLKKIRTRYVKLCSAGEQLININTREDYLLHIRS